MEVSVVIPAYNAAPTIENCIQSCIAQTLHPKEIIIVDDQSQDETWAVMHHLFTQYQEIPIILIQNITNLGVSATRNAGIAAAQYPVIALLDSDDTWHPQKLEICVSYLSKNPTVPIIFHDYANDANVTTTLSFSEITSHKEKIREVINSNKLQGSVIVFRNNGNVLFNPTYRYAEDLEFGIRYVMTAEIHHLTIALTKTNRLQLSAGGLSSNKWQMRKGEINAFLTLPKYHWKYYLHLPFLIGFSLLKHVRRMFISSKR